MTSIRIAILASVFVLAGCADDSVFANLENPDGSCKYGHKSGSGGIGGASYLFCAAEDSHARVGTR